MLSKDANGLEDDGEALLWGECVMRWGLGDERRTTGAAQLNLCLRLRQDVLQHHVGGSRRLLIALRKRHLCADDARRVVLLAGHLQRLLDVLNLKRPVEDAIQDALGLRRTALTKRLPELLLPLRQSTGIP